jgi:RNA polymerase sigma factor (sigma-70 family)
MSSLHLLDPQGSGIYHCAQAGCQACLNRLLEHHEGLIQVVVREQYLGRHAAYADLVQEGRIALWHAILRFDARRGVAFSSFAFVAIRRQIWRAVVLAERGWVGERRAAGLDPADQVEAAWFWQQLRVEVAQAGAQLPERLGPIISEYKGLDGPAPRTLKAVGQLHGFSGERARQLRNDALVLLRLPVLSALLRKICEYGDRRAYQRTQALSRHWLRQRHYYTVGWRQGERRRRGRREV